MSLADFYGPEFEIYHPEGCECPFPVDYDIHKNCCAWCGLVVHAREVEG
jgi:hypothetical protein